MSIYSKISIKSLSNAVSDALSELDSYDLKSLKQSLLPPTMESSAKTNVFSSFDNVMSSTSLNGSVAVLRDNLKLVSSISKQISDIQDLEKDINDLEKKKWKIKKYTTTDSNGVSHTHRERVINQSVQDKIDKKKKEIGKKEASISKSLS